MDGTGGAGIGGCSAVCLVGALAVSMLLKPPVRTTEVEIGRTGIETVWAEGGDRLRSVEFVHASHRLGTLLLSARDASVLEIPADQMEDSTLDWLCEQLNTRREQWNSPLGKAPEAMRALRGVTTGQ